MVIIQECEMKETIPPFDDHLNIILITNIQETFLLFCVFEAVCEGQIAL